MQLTSNVPHLLNAMYDWFIENNLTPYIVCEQEGVSGVPETAIRNGVVTLNIGPVAVRDLLINSDEVVFSTRFGGIPTTVRIKVGSVERIYAKEILLGMVFDNSEEGPQEPLPVPPRPAKSGKPQLKVIQGGKSDKGNNNQRS
jgi:stringent starvation protein B